MSHTDRLTVFLDDRDNRALRSARIKDGVPAADRIRAAVQLWQHGGPASRPHQQPRREPPPRHGSPGTPSARNERSRSP